MKKFNCLIALALFAGLVAISSGTVSAQDNPQAEKEREFYDVCYTKKDMPKCIPLAKELLEKYPSSQYAKFAQDIIKKHVIGDLWAKFETALTNNYTAPQNAEKLEALFTAGGNYLKEVPNQQYVIAQLALAGINGVLGQTYKDADKVKSHAEKAISAMEPTTAPEGWKPEDWTNLRQIVIAQGNQYIGYHFSEKAGSEEQAFPYLAKSIEVRGKDIGWKDPRNYWIRSEIYNKQYTKLSEQYRALPDDQKTADSGKAVLKQINEVVDKMLPEYARVIATATAEAYKPFKDAANDYFKSYWSYRTGAPEKAADYLKAFVADPTVAGPEIPAKAETSEPLVAAPTANVKGVGVGVAGVPGAKGQANGGGKPTKAKPAATTKKRGRRG